MNRDGSKGAGVLMEDVRNTGRSSEKAGSDLEVPAKAKRQKAHSNCGKRRDRSRKRGATDWNSQRNGVLRSPLN